MQAVHHAIKRPSVAVRMVPHVLRVQNKVIRLPAPEAVFFDIPASNCALTAHVFDDGPRIGNHPDSRDTRMPEARYDAATAEPSIEITP